MKISKSKVALAAKIKSSGFEWPQFGKWATQDKDGEVFISGGKFTPVRRSGEVNWCFDVPYKSAGKVEFGVGWFQCILSRVEYFHLYPAPDADGWIEWKGGECPVEKGTLVDVRFKDGMEMVGAPAGQTPDHFPRNMTAWARSSAPSAIIAYRLHKRDAVKPTDFGSVCDDETNLSDKEELETMEYKPSIEQLMQTYTDRAHSVQLANEHLATCTEQANEAKEALSVACKAAGFDISPITAKQEHKLTIADWRDLQVGDEVEIVESCSEERVGHIGVITRFSGTDEKFRVRVHFNGNESDYEWISKWRFTRRP